MPTLLQIDSSPLYGQSISRDLTSAFVAYWKSSYPDGTVIYRDLAATPIQPITAEWVGAAFTPQNARSPEQQTLLAQSEVLIKELEQADEIVLGVPMHNFGVPAVLKLWIDQIVRSGRALGVIDGKPQGLLRGRKTTVIVAAGGNYGAGSPIASWNHVEPYLRTILAFVGLDEPTFLTVGGTKALQLGGERGEFLAPHLAALQGMFPEPVFVP